MNELEARNTMQSTILTALPVPAARISWQGLRFIAPNASWISVTIVHDPSTQHTFGTPGYARSYRRTGGLTVQCFVPAKDGSMDDVITIARTVKNLFEGNTISGIRFFDAGIVESPPVEAEWLQANAVVTFQYEELK